MKKITTSNAFRNSLFICILLLVMSVFISSSMIAQTAWNYISPVPNSKFINPENNIAFRNGAEIDAVSINNQMISVTGSTSGIIEGSLQLSKDKQTIVFIADNPFKYNEVIDVKLAGGIKTINGNALDGAETSFTVISQKKPVKYDGVEVDNYNNTNNISNNQKSAKYSYYDQITYGNSSLPDNFPIPEILTFNNPSSELCFYSADPKTDRYDFYATIIDNYGTPVFYREWPSKTATFMVVPNNQLVHKNREPTATDKASFLVLNDKYEILDTLQVRNGYKTNTHDMVMRENGNHLLLIYDPQLVGMDTVVPGGDPNATVTGFVLQELDADHNVVFQWRSWDHFEITDATHVDLTSSNIDYVHVNAIDTTPDGNILLCCRHLDEITKIDRNTGDIIWRFGPQSKNNMFSFSNDTIGFSYPHDIQQLANGNLTMFDNGNFNNPQQSRGVEYEIDEINLTATLVWEYTNDPAIYAPTTGGTRRVSNGNTIIGWGSTYPIVSTEVAIDGNKEWELYLDSTISYRYLKYFWKTSLFETNVDTIDYGYYDGYEPWPVIFTVTNNVDYDISITSASNHSDAFFLETQLPIDIPAGESINMLINFFPEGMGELDFSDVLTLNYDSYYDGTLHQRISRQIFLKGTTIVPTYIESNDITNVSVYPNPANDYVRIVSGNKPINEITVYNLTGSKLKEIHYINNQQYNLDLSNYKPGVYFLDINVLGSTQNVKSKIVIK